MSETMLIGLRDFQVNCAFCLFKSANGLRVDLDSPTLNDSMMGGKLCRTCDLKAEQGGE